MIQMLPLFELAEISHRSPFLVFFLFIIHHLTFHRFSQLYHRVILLIELASSMVASFDY